MTKVTLTPERSRTMRAVRSSDTTPERVVRSFLHRNGCRFSLHRADLPGKPDIVLKKRRAVVLVHGCFWHGHYCKRGARVPKTNREYWLAKIARNKHRDVANACELKKLGWRVTIVWECETKRENSMLRVLRKVIATTAV